MRRPAIDLTGQRSGRLIVIERAEQWCEDGWLCRCDCGGEKIVHGNHLRNHKARSCGLQRCAPLKHRESGKNLTREYRTWKAMIQRCENPNHKSWVDYGGRGVKVCAEWRHDFSAFLAYVGRCPSPKRSLDRWPNGDGDYEPGNVRWATRSQQNSNKRRGAAVDLALARRVETESANA